MNNVETQIFLQNGRRKVVIFISVPQLFASQQAAIDALNKTVLAYQNGCDQPYNEFREPDNPFSAVVIHGFNE